MIMRRIFFSVLVGGGVLSLSHYTLHAFDSIEALSALFDFDMNAYQGRSADETGTRINKTWDFAIQRLQKFIYTAFKGSDLSQLTESVDKLGKEIFKFEIYKSKLQRRNEKVVQYKDKKYDKQSLLSKLNQLEKTKNALKTALSKKLGFKDKAKLFFSSKITKAIKNDEQEVKALLLRIVDLLGGVLTNLKKIVEELPEDQLSKKRAGY